jgi:6-phosphogluconolactonase
MTRARIVIVPTADDAADGAALHVAAALAAAVEARGVAHWATAGGSIAPSLYRHLTDRDHPAVPWELVDTWWGDDRFVGRDHPLSNVKPFDDIVMDIGSVEEGTALGLDGHPHHAMRPHVDRLHPFPNAEAIGMGAGAHWAATRIAEALAQAGLDADDGGFPRLDLVVLGLGGDGHTLSVFPGSEAFDSPAWTMAIPAPTHIEPHVERVTMTPAVVRAARDVLMVATGESKAEVIASVLGSDDDERRWPARLADLDQATWILDEAAAARLPR